MIYSVMIISKNGVLRFIKCYCAEDVNVKSISSSVFNTINESKDTLIIYDFPFNDKTTKICYRTFGSIYIAMIVDDMENERAILDYINVLMRAMNEVFTGVCEMHVIMNPEKVYLLFDEAISAGMVIETDVSTIVKNYKDKLIEDDNYKYFKN